MEKTLFDWTGWDGDQDLMTFYDVTLKRQIGSFPAGTHFDSATILFEEGVLQFSRYGERREDFIEAILVAEFQLRYEVGERIEKAAI